jgi:hypothetical protein
MSDTDHITPETVKAELENIELEIENDPLQVAINEKTAQEVENSQNEWKEIIQHIVGPAFGLLAPGWGVQPVEIEALAEAYAGLLNKYFPGGATQMGPELGAAMVTVAIIGPRLKMPRELPAPETPKNGD